MSLLPFCTLKVVVLLSMEGQNAHGLGLGTIHIRTGTVPVSVPVPNGTFFQYFTLSNNKNIYFSEKISPKLSISTFWTIGP